MLTDRKQQIYLEYLGLYDGKIDGKKGPKHDAAIVALQKKYMPESEWDGKYGEKTDIVLVNAYRVKKYTKNFKLEEFKCKCNGRYCTGYPARLDIQLLKNLQSLRNEFGSVIVTSGLRCTKYNNKMTGSSKTSKHLKGKALDIAILPLTNSESGRKKVMAYFKKLPEYNYTYCNISGNYPNMGNAVHIDVK